MRIRAIMLHERTQNYAIWIVNTLTILNVGNYSVWHSVLRTLFTSDLPISAERVTKVDSRSIRTFAGGTRRSLTSCSRTSARSRTSGRGASVLALHFLVAYLGSRS